VRIENAEGYSLEIGRLSASQALCTFRLPAGGQDALHAEKLPTFQVGAFPVQTVVAWPDAEEPAEDGGDFMEAARRAAGVAPLAGVSGQEVRFFCWQGLAGQASPTRGLLRQVMEGEELRVRFTLGDASTGETSLLLTGVRERVAATLGISENPTEADFLQDELLRLRVSYRSSTCYLLAGEKNRQRCLDDVNRCAQRPQESVIAMVGCIEVE
jgi:hypothetical protein